MKSTIPFLFLFLCCYLATAQCIFNDPAALESAFISCGPVAKFELHNPDGIIANTCPNDNKYSAEIRYSTFNTDGATDYKFCIQVDYDFTVDHSQFSNVTTSTVGLTQKVICGDISYQGQSSICASYFIKPNSIVPPSAAFVQMWLVLDNDMVCVPETFNLNPYLYDTHALNSGINNYSDINGVLAPALYLPQNSTIVLDESNSMTNILFFLDAGSKIVLPSGIEFTMNGTNIYGCERMHEGIEVENQGTFVFKDQSSIQDGLYGIHALDGGTLEITNSRFRDNLFHIYSANQSVTSDIIFKSFSGNLFEGTGSLKPRSNGLPNPSLPNAGIYLSRTDFVDVSTGVAVPNRYRNLSTGILITGGATSLIGNNIVEDCRTGISASGNFSPGTLIFNNDVTGGKIGIQAASTAASITGNFVTDSEDGIYLKGVGINAAIVDDNVVAVKERGIYSLYKSGFTEITNNNVSFTEENDFNIGIDLLFSDDFQASDNTVTIGLGDAGINFNTSENNHFFENTVAMTNPNRDVIGINLENASGTSLSCNFIDGPGSANFTSSTGMFTTNSPGSTFSCNYIENIETGLWYLGSSNNSVLEGNTLKENRVGIQLGLFTNNCSSPATTIGTQLHTGNLWDNSFLPTQAANYTNSVALVQASEFTVNTADNPPTGGVLLPSIIDLCAASPWFVNPLGTPSATYLCATANPCVDGPGARALQASTSAPGNQLVEYLMEEVANDDGVTEHEAWIMRQQLFASIYNNTAQDDLSVIERRFIATFTNTNIHSFTEIETILQQVKADPYLVSEHSQTLLVALEQYAKDQSKDSYATIKQSQNALKMARQEANKETLAILNEAQSKLDRILPENDIEEKYQQAYTLFIQFIRADQDITVLDQETLESLAEMCMTEYPASTLLARGLLSVTQNRTWEALDHCDLKDNKLPNTPTIEIAKKLVVVPNPAQTTVNTIGFTGVITIYNTVGVAVLQGKANEQIDIQSLPDGMYIIRDSNNQTVSFIKAN